MLIALDAMGGDHAPAEIVRGGADAIRRFGVDVAFVGIPSMIEVELEQITKPAAGVVVVPAHESIGMDEAPASAVRRKRDSSISVGLDLVKSGRADAFVSAGNTGAIMAAATLQLGRLPGLERPALGALLPARGGQVFLLDVGANADCRPSQLMQFAQMGQAYVRHVYGVREPRIGLLSIGEEDSKGNHLVQEAREQIKRHPALHFAGNVEGKEIPEGLVDVVVTDGFTGNVALKTAEGAAEFVVKELRDALLSRPYYRLLALGLRPAFEHLRRRIDYSERGGAPLLGVRGVVIIGHGRSNARAITNAIGTAQEAVSSGVLLQIGTALKGD